MTIAPPSIGEITNAAASHDRVALHDLIDVLTSGDRELTIRRDAAGWTAADGVSSIHNAPTLPHALLRLIMVPR